MRRWRVPVAGGVAGLLLVAVYFVGFHRPRSAEIARLESESDRLRSERAPLQREIAAMQQVADRKAEFDAALEVLEQLIPSGLAQPPLLAQLQAAADAAGVELVSVSFSEPEVPEAVPASPVAGTVLVAMPVTVVVEGRYTAVTEMLRRVETEVERAVLVGTLALTEAEPGFPELTATWSGHAYALLAGDDPLLGDGGSPPGAAGSPGPPGEPAATAPPVGAGG